jgi:hypothetical protein
MAKPKPVKFIPEKPRKAQKEEDSKLTKLIEDKKRTNG